MPEINKTEANTAEAKKSDFEKLEAMLQENLKSNAEVLKSIRDIKKYMRWEQLWSAFRFFLIAIPLILGFIYLPPLIQDALQYYKSLLP